MLQRQNSKIIVLYITACFKEKEKTRSIFGLQCCVSESTICILIDTPSWTPFPSSRTPIYPTHLVHHRSLLFIMNHPREEALESSYTFFFLNRHTIDLLYCVKLIYYVLLVSGVQQSESIIYIHIYTHIHYLSDSFPYQLLQNIEQNFLVLWAKVLGFHDGSTVKNTPIMQEAQQTWV